MSRTAVLVRLLSPPPRPTSTLIQLVLLYSLRTLVCPRSSAGDELSPCPSSRRPPGVQLATLWWPRRSSLHQHHPPPIQRQAAADHQPSSKGNPQKKRKKTTNEEKLKRLLFASSSSSSSSPPPPASFPASSASTALRPVHSFLEALHILAPSQHKQTRDTQHTKKQLHTSWITFTEYGILDTCFTCPTHGDTLSLSPPPFFFNP